MTPKQKQNYNNMHYTLKRIAKDYSNLRGLSREAIQIGLSYRETVEAAYENIKDEARLTISRIRPIK